MESVRRVLVIEDDDAVLYYVRVVLEKNGLQVLGTTDARKGVMLALQHNPDLVISDYHMPETSGLDVLEQLRGNPETSEIPFVLISVDPSPSLKKKSKARGSNAFVEKPFSPEDLMGVVRSLLNDHTT